MSHSDGGVPGATATGTILIIDPKKLWPVMAARGALAILFGIFALIWPGITVLALALLFGVWALLDGISLTASVSAVPEPANAALLLAGIGLVGFVARRRKA